MTKFLTLWKLDTTKIPEEPDEQVAIYTKLLNMVKEDFESYKMDWGEFVGGGVGYSISEGTEQEIALSLMKYSPYIRFKVHPVLSLEQTFENMKKLTQA
jgi:hypothetical protein